MYECCIPAPFSSQLKTKKEKNCKETKKAVTTNHITIIKKTCHLWFPAYRKREMRMVSAVTTSSGLSNLTSKIQLFFFISN